MGEAEDEEANSNSIYVPPDLLKDIFLRLPIKSLVKFKIVSKEWRLILESKWFVEMHLSCQKSEKSRRRKILAACHCDCGASPSLHPHLRFQGDEDIIVYLHCNVTRPSMSCDGLVCLPEPGWVNVVNPATGQLRAFPSGPDPVSSLLRPQHNSILYFSGDWSTFFPGYWSMGFGRDKVNGSYKVVRMFFHPNHCEILDVNIGEWRKLSPPPYEVYVGRKSASVNGSIYWLEIAPPVFKILALDLHTEEFRDVPMPTVSRFRFKSKTLIVNLEDRLALVTSGVNIGDEWEIEIQTMNEEEQTWSLTYCISLADLAISPREEERWFTPVKVSKQGNVLIYDNRKEMLLKYCPHSNTVRQIFPHNCIILSPYLETLFRLHTDDQVGLRSQRSCLGRKTCIFKDGTASSAHVISLFQLIVDKFLCKGKELGILLWRNKMEIFCTCILLRGLYLFECFCGLLHEGDIFEFLAMLIFIKLVMSMPRVGGRSYSFLFVVSSFQPRVDKFLCKGKRIRHFAMEEQNENTSYIFCCPYAEALIAFVLLYLKTTSSRYLSSIVQIFSHDFTHQTRDDVILIIATDCWSVVICFHHNFDTLGRESLVSSPISCGLVFSSGLDLIGNSFLLFSWTILH